LYKAFGWIKISSFPPVMQRLKIHSIAIAAILVWNFSPSDLRASVPNPVTGSVTVSDSNSLGTDLVIGNSSQSGSLSINSGGNIQNLNAYLGADPIVGGNAVQVSGTGLWSNNGDLYVGFSGASNSLNVIGGGSVIGTGVAYLGWDTTASSSTITVSEGGSTWTNQGDFYMGSFSSNNALTITNGGQAIIQGSTYVASQSSSSGNSITISGQGSALLNSRDFYFGMAGGGGNLTISGGATLSASDSYLGLDPYSTGNSVLVTGSGSSWSNSGVLVIGAQGGAAVTAADGASITASEIDLGQNSGSSGSLQIGNGGAPGNILSPIVNFGTDGGSLVFDHNSTNYIFAPNLNGPGSMQLIGSGRTILTGNNSGFSGPTTLTAGTLALGSSNALGSTSITVNGNATIQAATQGLNLTNPVSVTLGNTARLDAGGFTFLVSSSISGAGSLYLSDSTGSGTLVMAGTNTYSGGTTLGSGALVLSNSEALGSGPISLGGSGNASFVIDNETLNIPALTLENGSLVTVGPNGILQSSPQITINGGELLDNGLVITPLLAINSTGILAGSGVLQGNVQNNGSVLLSGAGGALTINGNYSQGHSGNITLVVSGGSSFERLVVNGSASLSGSLSIVPQAAGVLVFGQKLNFMTANSISGSFDSIIAPNGYRGRLMIEGDPTASILIAPASYTEMAMTQNERNVAAALNSFITAASGDRQVVSIALDELSAEQYAGAFESIEPTIYQSLGTIAFNLANAQNMELAQRLWGQRVAGSGFSMNGFADNTPIWEGQGDGFGGKDSILRKGPDNRWGLFVDGNGIFAQANSANMLPTYNAQSGGVTTGVSFRINPTLSVGAYTGYEGTSAKFNGGSSLTDNSVRFGVFGTYGQKDGRGFYVSVALGGGYNEYQVSRSIQFPGINRTANSSPGAGELDTMIATGYDIQVGKFTFGPITSLQYTYLGVNSLNETGAQSLNYNSSGWNSSSMLSSVGAHAAYNWVAHHGSGGDIVVVPQINLNWQHEFMQNQYEISGNLGGTSPTFSNWSTAPIRDFLYTGVGVTVDIGKRWNTSFFYNAVAGNQNLTSQNIFWSAGVKF
jgi:T5SS/PEP-CTERM-associated repeat protein/autotransporter-associated beta strand protein